MPESYAIKSGMVETDGGGGVAFPVVFFDGECETDIGNVVVYPALEFKRFQSILSQKIGISPHQFSVYLSSAEAGRRIPITGKVNFGAISREKGYFFLVVLKRSRRERRRKSQQESEGDVYYTSPMKPQQKPIKKNPPDNVMLLRRDTGIINQDQAFSGQQLNLPYAYRVEYENRVRDLQLERERYLMNMGLTGSALSTRENGMVGEKGGRGGGMAVCDVCLEAKEMGREVGFHWCIYDAITFGFRSPAGPIARPVKGSD